MRSRSLFLVAVALAALSLAAWATEPRSQESVRVTFQHSVIIGNTQLPAGTYYFREVNETNNPNQFWIYNAQQQAVGKTPIGTPIINHNNVQTPTSAVTQTKVVLKKINGQSYLYRIWIHNWNRGLEFAVPSASSAQTAQVQNPNITGQPENNNEENVAASVVAGNNQLAATQEEQNETPAQEAAEQSRNTSAVNTGSTTRTPGATAEEGTTGLNNENSVNTGMAANHNPAGAGTTGVASAETGANAGIEGQTNAGANAGLSAGASPTAPGTEAGASAGLNAGATTGTVGANAGVSAGENQSGVTTENGAAAPAQNTNQGNTNSALTQNNSNWENNAQNQNPQAGTQSNTNWGQTGTNAPEASSAVGANAGAATTPRSGTAEENMAAGQQMSTSAGTTGESISSITGCLAASTTEPGQYVIQARSGKTTNVDVTPDMQSMMQQQIGHQVRLVGRWSTQASANTGMTGSASGETANVLQNKQEGTAVNTQQPNQSGSFGAGAGPMSGTFNAQRIDVISQTCPATGAQQ